MKPEPPFLEYSSRTRGEVLLFLPGSLRRFTNVPHGMVQQVEEFLDKYKSEIPKLAPNWEGAWYSPGSIGGRVRFFRWRKGLTQGRLSRLTGISQCNISQIERGQRIVGKVVAQRLGRVLEVPYHTFL